MEEIWKDIPNYEKYYKISNYGVIVSIPRNGTMIFLVLFDAVEINIKHLMGICGDMQKNSISLLHFYTNTF